MLDGIKVLTIPKCIVHLYTMIYERLQHQTCYRYKILYDCAPTILAQASDHVDAGQLFAKDLINCNCRAQENGTH